MFETCVSLCACWCTSCAFTCLLRSLEQENVFPQYWHSKGLIPSWFRMCILNELLNVNCLEQSSHWYGFSPGMKTKININYRKSCKCLACFCFVRYKPVWIRVCFLQSLCVIKLLSQNSHLCGLKPVWMRRWLANRRLSLKILLHSGQVCNFSSGGVSMLCCILAWRLYCDCDANWEPHTSHLNGRSPLCMRWCTTSWCLYMNAFVHSVHLNCGSIVCNFSWEF